MWRKLDIRTLRSQILAETCKVVMSKTKGQTFRYRFGTKPKRFGLPILYSIIENRLFRLDPESALMDQIEIISFDKTNSGTNSNVCLASLL